MGDQDQPEPHVVVVFGATGDLAKRSLFPALFQLHAAGALRGRVVGSGLDPQDVGAFREHVAGAVREFVHEPDAAAVDRFVAAVDFAAARDDDLGALVAAVHAAEEETGPGGRRLVYLSVPPTAVAGMVAALGREGLAERTRLIVEKPFGRDLASGREMFDAIAAVFDERDVFRIDHFLGMRSLLDLVDLRVAHPAAESLWSAEAVEQVLLDVPEKIDVEGRGAFLESTGTFRDMVSSHLLQVLAWVAMELPRSRDEEGLRAAREPVFAALRPLDPAEAVFGQYRGYRDTEGVAADSQTETFAAATAWVDDDRWSGVPFLLRTGKAMAATRWAVTLRLRVPVPQAYAELAAGPTEIVVALDDAAAYRHLLHDALRGDRTLFVDADPALRLWEVCAPVLDRPPAVQGYDRGSWGPQAAQEMAGPDGWQVER